MPRAPRLVLTPVLILLGVFLPAVSPRAGSRSQQGSTAKRSQTGSYKVTGQEGLSGSERFSITEGPVGVVIETEDDTTQDRSPTDLSTNLELVKGAPSRYSLTRRLGAAVRTFVFEFTDTAATATIESAGSRTQRSISLHPGFVVLDSDVWSHYRTLLARYDLSKKGLQQFYVFVPSTLGEYSGELEYEGSEEIHLHGRKIDVNKFAFRLADGYDVDILAGPDNSPVEISRYFDKRKAVLE